MRLIQFQRPNGDVVFVNPETVIRVNVGRTGYSEIHDGAGFQEVKGLPADVAATLTKDSRPAA